MPCGSDCSQSVMIASRKNSDSYELDTVVVQASGHVVDIEDVDGRDPSCFSVSVLSACVIAIVCASIVLGRDYIKYVLLSLDNTNIIVSFAVFSLLFTAVAFPVAWGYILLTIAAGYLYGVFAGLFIVVICAMFGVLVAHIVIRRFLENFVRSKLVSPNMRSVINVVEGEHGFKAIMLSRLTPIPFGLQNSLFAVSRISYYFQV